MKNKIINTIIPEVRHQKKPNENLQILVNYVVGSYGTFVMLFLSGKIKFDNIDFKKTHFHYIRKLIPEFIGGTHKSVDNFDNQNLKITYKKEHVDLICRNKWQKLEDDFESVKERSFLMFKDYGLDIDQNSKEIITISFYKNAMLHGLTEWNEISNKNTIELPFSYFLSDHTDWLKHWDTIFKKLKIDVTTKYISEAYSIFNQTQSSLFQSHNLNKDLIWKEKDTIAKGNALGELYFQKHSEKNIPIDIVKYRDTQHMLLDWLNILNHTNSTEMIR